MSESAASSYATSAYVPSSDALTVGTVVQRASGFRPDKLTVSRWTGTGEAVDVHYYIRPWWRRVLDRVLRKDMPTWRER